MHRIRTRRAIAGLVVILFAAVAAPPANAEGAGNILYHEALRPLQPAATSRPGAKEILSFDALGQRFELHLRVNGPLQRRVQRRGYALLKGKLSGRPGSWARIARRGQSLSGMFFDGNELYAIEPWAEVASQALVGGGNDGQVNVVFRLRDVMLPSDAAGCGPATMNAEVRGDIAFGELMRELGELPAFAAQGAHRQIALQAVADFEFFDRWGSEAEAQILARLNVVDGIFSDQFDLEVAVGTLDIFESPADPFTTSDPNDLLEEVSDYRASSSTGDGITHLFTWRNLDGTTRGIAYLGSACMTRFGASLSQQFLSSLTTGALIVAHELGHNFGAQHDGETPIDPGLPNPCESVPENFLMAPIIGASSTFSQCSLDTMEAFLSLPQASCVSDIGVRMENLENPVTLQVNTQKPLNFSVVNAGGGTATGVELNLSYPVALDLLPQNLACNVGIGSADCPLGDLPDSAQRPVSFSLQSAELGTYSLDINVSTDQSASADSAQIDVNVQLDAPAATSGGGGGGGGGGLALLSLAALLGMGASRKRRTTGPRRPPH
ncbi:MAG: M12 family metallo-peptidase [Gammaproteobacteria bacterium]